MKLISRIFDFSKPDWIHAAFFTENLTFSRIFVLYIRLHSLMPVFTEYLGFRQSHIGFISLFSRKIWHFPEFLFFILVLAFISPCFHGKSVILWIFGLQTTSDWIHLAILTEKSNIFTNFCASDQITLIFLCFHRKSVNFMNFWASGNRQAQIGFISRRFHEKSIILAYVVEFNSNFWLDDFMDGFYGLKAEK